MALTAFPVAGCAGQGPDEALLPNPVAPADAEAAVQDKTSGTDLPMAVPPGIPVNSSKAPSSAEDVTQSKSESLKLSAGDKDVTVTGKSDAAKTDMAKTDMAKTGPVNDEVSAEPLASAPASVCVAPAFPLAGPLRPQAPVSDSDASAPQVGKGDSPASSSIPAPAPATVPPPVTIPTDIRTESVRAIMAPLPFVVPPGEKRSEKPSADDAASLTGTATADRPGSLAATGSATGSVVAPEALRAPLRQMALALASRPGEGVEMEIGPKELGRVRLTMHATDTAVTVQIVAERAETLDLMRRHVAEFAADLRAMGFGDVNFAFGKQQDRAPPSELPPIAFAMEEEGFAPASLAATSRPTAASGLDLRL